MFPEEKVRNEVATMRYILDQTSIPVPFVLHWGTRKDGPLNPELGPFIIMEYMDHHTNMYDVLNMPGRPRASRGIIGRGFDEDKLEGLYGELANVLLRLSQPSLSRIGSLSQIDDFTWEVAYRPLSMPMNELIRLGALPQACLPGLDTTIDTASSYFESLAELHIIHLMNQRNDAVDSADDCRRKFVARCLFRKLAREQKLTERWASFKNGPFKLWCDDFRPGNVLLNKDSKIAAVVDWEFTYAAPIEFSYAPPWWLLIEKPEYWPTEGGLEDWCSGFECRLQTFLKAMINREDEAISKCQVKENQRLSGPMRESWESGAFCIAYAARNNFAFDAIYWQKIDWRFFGRTSCPDPADAWKERLEHLNADEKRDMKQLFVQKLEEMKSRVLAWDPDEYTLGHVDLAKKAREESEIKQGTADESEKPAHIEVDATDISTEFARLAV
ncbi:Aminoglycoside phosphotransferase [Penicillium samsonianum]|uniref:Aminoglycoside phosphotransferase n=1 Tax=Penicillium samsonianum TaxID=1882272 RepID=UPI00254681C0|nr:Aminoglycoside phosphotransferase [Penicillium samsonianum]KAJ6139306.1 Aminoglycoside phosphotransferase [Penicillium samsonianum]